MTNDFEKLVSGFDFLQGLSKQPNNETQASPTQASHFGHWVTPTFNAEELEKRIADLKTVQFWLDQNTLALKATIQALEVQKMTLTALKSMNLNMVDIANGLKVNTTNATKTAKATDNNAASNPTDPAAWWRTLTQQFQQIALNTVQEANKKTVSKKVKKTSAGTTEIDHPTTEKATKTSAKVPRKAPIRKHS